MEGTESWMEMVGKFASQWGCWIRKEGKWGWERNTHVWNSDTATLWAEFHIQLAFEAEYPLELII
jgi:hypothetical protein